MDPPSPRLPWLGSQPGAKEYTWSDRARSLPPPEILPRARPSAVQPAEAEPPRPLPGRAPDPDFLASALAELGKPAKSLHFGPYAAVTDVADSALLTFLGQLAEDVERLYTTRYGLRPVGEAREEIVLFRDEGAYRRLARRDSRIAELASAGHTVNGMVLLYAGDRPAREVGATLVHELVHLLNRRSLGPALPPWLDEGMAEDLAQSRIGPGGKLEPGTVGGQARDLGDHVELHGGLAAALVLQDAVAAGTAPRVEDLLASPWEEFVAAGRDQRYDAACFFVRYLVDGEGGALAPGFRAYLAALADGGPADAESLRARIDRPWPLLDMGWHVWLQGIDVRELASRQAA